MVFDKVSGQFVSNGYNKELGQVYADEGISGCNTKKRLGFQEMIKDALDGKGELLLTIMASLSQEEARSISENVTWGHRKRFADGKVSLAYSNFLGYDKGEDGNLVVNKEEAKTIELIYKMFLEGKSFYTIAKDLTSMGI